MTPWFFANLVFICGLVVTYQLWSFWQEDNDKKINAALNHSADISSDAIQSHIEAIAVIMKGVKGLIDASEHVTPEIFHDYIHALNLNKDMGVAGIALVELLDFNRKSEHIERIHTEGFNQYRIKPAGDRPYYAPITLIEPLNKQNIKALGFDVFTVQESHNAMMYARDFNEITITSPISLVQDEGKSSRNAFVMYLPIYKKNVSLDTLSSRRNAIIGWVDVPFRVNEMIHGLGGQIDQDLYLEIYAGAIISDANLLYHSDRFGGRIPRGQKRTYIERKLTIANSEWTLLLGTTPSFESRILSYDKANYVTWLGVFISLLLALLTWFLMQRNKHAENRYQKLFNQATVGVLLLNNDHQFVKVNEAALDLLGYSHEALTKVLLWDVISESHVQEEAFMLQVKAEIPIEEEWTFIRKNGSQFIAEVNCRKLDNSFYFLTIRDLTERKKAEQRILRLTRLYKALTQINEAIVRMGDEHNLFPLVCQCAVDLGDMKMAWIGKLELPSEKILVASSYGIGVEYALKLNLSANANTSEGRGPTGVALRENKIVCINDYKNDDMTLRWHHHAKKYGWNSAASFPIQRNGKPFAVLNVYHAEKDAFDDEAIALFKEMTVDISFALDNFDNILDRKLAEDRVRFLSNFDALTSLPNRNLLSDRTKLALNTAKRTNTPTTLMYLDIDRFKNINESLGPTIGDSLIKEISQRLIEGVHSGDTICRQGGDEFILLLPDTNAEGAAHLAKRIMDIISQPFTIGSQRITLTTSIGIAEFPQDGDNFDQLVQSADAALFRAKQAGRNNFQFFAQQMHDHVKEIIYIENELRHAIYHNQLTLHYQPQFDTNTHKIVGIESLIRWQHPKRGLIPSNQFITIAEESGLIVDIGNWVLQTAVQQLANWQNLGLSIVPIAVNLSVVQFKHHSLYTSICQVLRNSKLSPEMLELEMTEGIAMENSEHTIALLEQLSALGVKLSIDDFGTGYSSLSYLKRFKIDKLKIDQSFIRDLLSHPEDAAIVISIINIAKSLGFKSIAEGVETKEQLDFLQQNKCDEIQGYYFSEPLTAFEMEELLREAT